ncbi:MAG: hypothetical protein C0510_10775 [Erythrobacter sp.]|nr:hypothetical protein [Erythrobacter sp.]
MNYILVPALVILMGLTLLSLIRGIIAFLRTTRVDLESGGADNVREMQLKQNRAMIARIKYQALAILVVVLILAFSR